MANTPEPSLLEELIVLYLCEVTGAISASNLIAKSEGVNGNARQA